jgi:hypothetical protein
MYGAHGKVANGNIAPSRFVTLDSTAAGRVVQATTGDLPFGISQPQTRRIALSGTDDGYAAIADENINVYGPGDPGVLLELGGTVSHGDLLKPTTGGKGITASSDHDKYGARALASGTSGQLIPVEVLIGERSV